jgi:hypothetical protein
VTADGTERRPLHFIDQPIDVRHDSPPARQKLPPCPSSFTWNNGSFKITEIISEWTDFGRRGRNARNMSPAHASAAASRGSLNVGRFFFRVRVDTGQVFDVYYDRAMKNIDQRKGQWFVYREMET